MTPVNDNFLPQYAAQAIVDLELQAKRLRNTPGLGFYISALQSVVLLMRYAVHVVLPVNGEIYRGNDMPYDVAPSVDEVESFCLPAPVTCFQYPWTHYKGDGEIQAPKRITLVSDGRQTHGEPPPGSVCCTTFFSVVFHEIAKKWTLLDNSLLLAEPLEIDRAHKPWGFRSAIQGLSTGKYLNPMDDPALMRMHGEWKSDITAVVQCCHALRAGATLVEKTEPSSSRRRKFDKKGVGGFVYHVLTLPAHTASSYQEPIGTHESPRFHVRRAHIRKLPTGILTFVRQCFVGDPSTGTVEKTYRIKSASELCT
jgi:hypothetical protein